MIEVDTKLQVRETSAAESVLEVEDSMQIRHGAGTDGPVDDEEGYAIDLILRYTILFEMANQCPSMCLNL